MHEHKPAGVAHRQYPEHHSIHNTEDRRVCPDAERKGKNSDRRKAWILAECAKGESEVRPQLVHPLQSPRLPAFVFCGFGGPEFDTGTTRGLAPIHAGADKIVDISVDIKPDLGSHIALESLAAKELHDPSGTAPRTLATTIEKRFQDSASALSCFRPPAVNL